MVGRVSMSGQPSRWKELLQLQDGLIDLLSILTNPLDLAVERSSILDRVQVVRQEGHERRAFQLVDIVDVAVQVLDQAPEKAQALQLELLLAANKRLHTAYLLKESFGQLWSYHREGWARRFFENWRAALKWQRLKPFEHFAAMIERHGEGIAAYCQPENKVALGFVEGLNNKMRVIQRRAYGLRDEEYLR